MTELWLFMWEQQARQTNKHETVSGSDSISSDFINEKIIQKNQKFSRNALHIKNEKKGTRKWIKSWCNFISMKLYANGSHLAV